MGIYTQPDNRPHPFNQEIMAAGQSWLETALKQKERQRVATGARATAELLNIDPNLYSQLLPDQQKNTLDFMGKRETNQATENYRMAKLGGGNGGMTGGPTFASENSQLSSDYKRRQELDLAPYFKKDLQNNFVFDFEKKGANEALARWRQENDPRYEEAQRDIFSRYGSQVPAYYQDGTQVPSTNIGAPQSTPEINLRKLQGKKPAGSHPNAVELLPGNMLVKSVKGKNGKYAWTPIDQNDRMIDQQSLPEMITNNGQMQPAMKQPSKQPADLLIETLTERMPPQQYANQQVKGKQGEMYISDGVTWTLIK